MLKLFSADVYTENYKWYIYNQINKNILYRFLIKLTPIENITVIKDFVLM